MNELGTSAGVNSSSHNKIDKIVKTNVAMESNDKEKDSVDIVTVLNFIAQAEQIKASALQQKCCFTKVIFLPNTTAVATLAE